MARERQTNDDRNDLIACQDMFLFLISDAGDPESKGAAVAAMSKKMGITKSAVRMIRLKLVWMLRKKILGYVGKDEYLILSAVGSLPGRNWK